MKFIDVSVAEVSVTANISSVPNITKFALTLLDCKVCTTCVQYGQLHIGCHILLDSHKSSDNGIGL